MQDYKKYLKFAQEHEAVDEYYIGYRRGLSERIATEKGEKYQPDGGYYQSAEYADGKRAGLAGEPPAHYSGYALNKNAAKAEAARDGRLSGRVASEDLANWKKQAEEEGITRTDLIIRVMNDYCTKSA